MSAALPTVWFGVVVLAWVLFFTLEGFDFGVGFLGPVLGRTDSERVAPPSTPTQPSGAASPAGTATTICEIPAARRAATLHSSIGRPARTTNALGLSDPRRSPLPAATRRATATFQSPPGALGVRVGDRRRP